MFLSNAEVHVKLHNWTDDWPTHFAPYSFSELIQAVELKLGPLVKGYTGLKPMPFYVESYMYNLKMQKI